MVKMMQYFEREVFCNCRGFISRVRGLFFGQRWLWMFVMLLLFGLREARAQEPAEVLIINSYHPGYAWSDGEMRGVLRSLVKEHPKMLPGIEYLDWIRYPTPENERQFLDRLKLKYGAQKLRAIITLDDKALELVLLNRNLFGPDVPIIFGGVNFYTPQILRGQTNITGVAETKDLSRTLDLLLRLQPDVKEIVGYHDDTESALANRRALESFMPKYATRLKFRFIENWSVEELFNALGKLGPHTAVIGLGSSHDRNGQLLANNADFLNSVSSRCSVPIYIISEPVVPLFNTEGWDSAAWTGVGGSLVSSDLHGELVGKMANQILRGAPADTIPVVPNTPTRLAVDWRQMKRFNLSVDALPQGTEVFHNPQSYYTINKSKILAGLALVVILIISVLVLAVNIILRRRAERENLQLAAAVKQALELIIMVDVNGIVRYVNPAFTRITGLTIKEAQQPNFLQSTLGVRGDVKSIAQTLQERGVWSQRLDYCRQNNSVLHLSLVASTVQDGRGDAAGYIIMGRDVTHENKLEEQVRNAQKMEAIGLLAGGVAHDFNNLLQIVSGHAQLALDDDITKEEQIEHLDHVVQASDRAANLTRQLLAFGRRQPLRKEDTDLNQVVSNLLKMIRRVIGEHLEINFIPGHELGNVRADRSQIEQVLLNLCMNARDAMPTGGRLTIELENVCIDSIFTEAHPWARPGRYVLLSTADTGFGMDKKTQSRVFEPFFSTKQKDKGTGLGLAVVHGIVQQHDGFIHVYSEPGRGTTFKVYFPIVARRAAVVGNKLAVPQTVLGSGTILLVEDEKGVRDLGFDILRKAGYKVLTATNGLEAVQVFENHMKEIRLVLMDIVMPVMNGPEACARMIALRPDIPVLYCSGYSSDSLDNGFDLQPDQPLIQKPYHPEQLLAQVAALLDKAAEAPSES